jgi:16S rRNA G966 N2-methylase RsmD
VLDTKSGNWQKRKTLWRRLGLKSEEGRDATVFGMASWDVDKTIPASDTSIFDPALCEVLYEWFCPKGGLILDPFAGGSVRGIVANYLGYAYTGIDIRQEQIDSNRAQALKILPVDNQPQWFVGDSNEVLDGRSWRVEFDLILSCPPYADLEVYSDLSGDISNKPYPEFLKSYREIIAKSCKLLKPGGFACFVVGEVRDKSGYYRGFVPDTIKAFEDCGTKYYNEAILLGVVGSASLRANGNMKTKKLVKTHQNVLVFKKPGGGHQNPKE